MTKLNTGKKVVTSPMQAETTPSGKTHEGAPGFARTPETELFMKATTTFAGEGGFYEDATATDERAVELARQIAVDNWPWMAGFLPWLRSEGNIRTYSLMLAAEAADAVADRPWPIGGLLTPRQVVDLVQQRGDEPGEILQYCKNTFRYTKKTARNGQPRIPLAVLHGTGDAALRLYTQRSALRYDGKGPMKFADVIELTHPDIPGGPDTADTRHPLFKHLLDERHHPEGYEPPENLFRIHARRELSKLIPVGRHELALAALQSDGPARKKIWDAAAGQWEWTKSWLGEKPEEHALTDKQIWELCIPQMGYMALIRNLRNFDQAEIGPSLAHKIAQKIADPGEVAMSRQLPFRFLTAWLNATGMSWGPALEQALQAAIPNVPELDGHTLILIDTSGSMEAHLSERPAYARAGTTVARPSRAQAAALFGLALALKNPGKVDVYGFADTNFIVENISAGSSLLRTVELFCAQIGKVGHGTRIEQNLRETYKNRKGGYTRVCLFTDEQAFGYGGYHFWGGHIGDVTNAIPKTVPIYSWNLAGYTHGCVAAGDNRYQLAGLTDASFRIMSMIEAGQNGRWPWENTA